MNHTWASHTTSEGGITMTRTVGNLPMATLQGQAPEEGRWTMQVSPMNYQGENLYAVGVTPYMVIWLEVDGVTKGGNVPAKMRPTMTLDANGFTANHPDSWEWFAERVGCSPRAAQGMARALTAFFRTVAPVLS